MSLLASYYELQIIKLLHLTTPSLMRFEANYPFILINFDIFESIVLTSFNSTWQHYSTVSV